MIDEDAFEQAMADDPDATVALLVEMGKATDETLRAKARALARRLILDVSRRGVTRRPGVHRLRPQRADQGGELDVDASLSAIVDARAGARVPDPDELVARGWARPDLALCVLVDASGSMSGERLAAAALTAGAVTWRAPEEHAVLSFSRTVEVVRDIGSERPAAAVVDTVLNLRGHGVTALATALRAATEQLSRSRAARRVAVLLSDCRATDDEDPVPAAELVPELAILAPTADSDQAEDLARRTGARWTALSGSADAPAALGRVLGL